MSVEELELLEVEGSTRLEVEPEDPCEPEEDPLLEEPWEEEPFEEWLGVFGT